MASPGLSLPATTGLRGFGSSAQRGGDGLDGTRRREEGEAGQSRTTPRQQRCWRNTTGFQMPLHYPRYKREDYEKMEGWKVDVLLREYGLSFDGSLHDKRAYAMGAFLWPDQL